MWACTSQPFHRPCFRLTTIWAVWFSRTRPMRLLISVVYGIWVSMESSRIFRIASDQCSWLDQGQRHCKRRLFNCTELPLQSPEEGIISLAAIHTTLGRQYPWPFRCSKGDKNATGDPTLRWEVARGWRLGRQSIYDLDS